MAKKRISRFCKKGQSQYEITIGGGRPDDYGMPTNPPIVVCAKSKKSALRNFKFPKSVKVKSVKRV